METLQAILKTTKWEYGSYILIDVFVICVNYHMMGFYSYHIMYHMGGDNHCELHGLLITEQLLEYITSHSVCFQLVFVFGCA